MSTSLVDGQLDATALGDEAYVNCPFDQAQYREVRDKTVEQMVSFKRVEDQLGMVSEATDRNTLEQQELIGELKGVGKKINFMAMVALGLLAVTVVTNIVLCLRILKVLH